MTLMGAGRYTSTMNLPALLPELSRLISEAPSSPGVYIIYGEPAGLPLYIGKSINIRSRLQSHSRSAKSRRFLDRAQRIEYRLTAGEVGALLLESQLIKTMRPLYNKRLRRNRRLCSVRLQGNQIQVVDTTQPTPGAPLYGLFRTPRSANEALRQLADTHGLCLSLLGLEPPTNRACFRAQLGKCRGACHGKESHSEHQSRLQTALQQLQIHYWPYPGAIAIHEQHGGLEEFHVINHWHYLGSWSTRQEAHQAPAHSPSDFDADSYLILLRPVLEAKGIVHLPG